MDQLGMPRCRNPSWPTSQNGPLRGSEWVNVGDTRRFTAGGGHLACWASWDCGLLGLGLGPVISP
eukprot:5190916-Alexandrium_andersonii.AAC.1